MSQALDPPCVRPLQNRSEVGRGRQDRGRDRLAIPTVGLETPQDLIGQADGAQGILSADTRTRFAPCRRDEVLEFEGQGIAGLAMDLVHAQDLAEEMSLDRGGLAQVHAVQVEPASLELFRGSNQGRLLGREVERGVALRAQIRIFRTDA